MLKILINLNSYKYVVYIISTVSKLYILHLYCLTQHATQLYHNEKNAVNLTQLMLPEGISLPSSSLLCVLSMVKIIANKCQIGLTQHGIAHLIFK